MHQATFQSSPTATAFLLRGVGIRPGVGGLNTRVLPTSPKRQRVHGSSLIRARSASECMDRPSYEPEAPASAWIVPVGMHERTLSGLYQIAAVIACATHELIALA